MASQYIIKQRHPKPFLNKYIDELEYAHPLFACFRANNLGEGSQGTLSKKGPEYNFRATHSAFHQIRGWPADSHKGIATHHVIVYLG